MLRNLAAKIPVQSYAKNVFLFWVNIALIFIVGTFLTLFCRQILLPAEVYADYPLNFVFRTCDKFGLCSYPEANVYLVKPNGDLLLESGVSYGVSVDFVLPDSATNRESGMFLLVLKFENNEKKTYKIFQKSALIPYRSRIVRFVRTLLMLPFFIFDWSSETLFLSVHFFDDFVIGPYDSVLSLSVELQHTSLQISQSNLRITANLRGVRYFLYYWPLISTSLLFVFVISCLFCLSLFYWLVKSLVSLVGKVNDFGDSLSLEIDDETTTKNGELRNKSNTNSLLRDNNYHKGENGLFNGFDTHQTNGDMFVKRRR